MPALWLPPEIYGGVPDINDVNGGVWAAARCPEEQEEQGRRIDCDNDVQRLGGSPPP